MSGRVKWTIAAHSTCLDHKRPCAVHALISAKGQQRTSRGPIRSPRPRASSHDGGGHLRPCPLWAKSGHETMGPDRGTGWVSRADRFAVSFVIAVCAKSYLSRACFWFRSQVQRLAIAVGIGTGTMSVQRLTHMGLRPRKIVCGGGDRGEEAPIPPTWYRQIGNSNLPTRTGTASGSSLRTVRLHSRSMRFRPQASRLHRTCSPSLLRKTRCRHICAANVIGLSCRELRATEFFIARRLSPVAGRLGTTSHLNTLSRSNGRWTCL